MAKTQIRTGDIGTSEITDSDVAAANKDGTKSTYSMRTLSASAPAAIGTAAAGSSTAGSSSDHVHATGAGTPSTQAFGDAAATGSGPAAAMTDHKHAMPAAPIADHTHDVTGNGSTGGGSTLSPNILTVDNGANTTATVRASSAANIDALITGEANPMVRLGADAGVYGGIIYLGPGGAGSVEARIFLTASEALEIADAAGADLTSLTLRTALATITGDLTVTGADILLSTDARVRRSATKTLMLDDGAGATLTKLDMKGLLLAWGGTSFPASPATDDHFYRTDLDMMFFYDGTRWLSETLFTQLLLGTNAIAATTTTSAVAAPISRGSDIWLERLVTQFFVASGGTALAAGHNWVGVTNKVVAANTNTGIDTNTINSGSSGVWRQTDTAMGALMNNGTTHYALRQTWTKTGTPGTFTHSTYLLYRMVAT